MHTEYGAASHVGRHSLVPIRGDKAIKMEGWEEQIVQSGGVNMAKVGDWSENYAAELFDWHLHISENDSTITGNAQWAFKDFGTPLRPENAIPYVNQKGLMDRAGNPKDSYYVFKSFWAKDKFIFIDSPNWTERQGPADFVHTLKVYSNVDQVSLSLNGVDLGSKSKDKSVFPAQGLFWNAKLKEGENVLVAKGAGLEETLTINYRTNLNSAPKELELTYNTVEGQEEVTCLQR